MPHSVDSRARIGKKFAHSVVPAAIFVAVILAGAAFAARSVPAMLCSSCGFGMQKNKCLACGRETFGSEIPARLCGSCGFGNRAGTCVKCGRNTFGRGERGVYCSSCAFSKKDKCFKCGRHLFD